MNYREMKRSELEKVYANKQEEMSILSDDFASPEYMDPETKTRYYALVNDISEIETSLHDRDENSKHYAKQYGDKKKRSFQRYHDELSMGSFSNPGRFINHTELRKNPSMYRGKWFNTIIDLKVNDDHTITKPMVQYLNGSTKEHLLDNSKRNTSIIFEKSLPKEKKFQFRDSSNGKFLIDYSSFNDAKIAPFTDRP